MAISRVPRELFVPEHLEGRAYDDTPLPIGLNQTISAPHMVAIMSQLLDLLPGMKVLEVGGGSGYHAAVMAVLVGPEGHIYSVERKSELAALARKNLEKANIANVTIIEADGSLGLAGARSLRPHKRRGCSTADSRVAQAAARWWAARWSCLWAATARSCSW